MKLKKKWKVQKEELDMEIRALLSWSLEKATVVKKKGNNGKMTGNLVAANISSHSEQMLEP